MNDMVSNNEFSFGSFQSIIEIDAFARNVVSSIEPGFIISQNDNGETVLTVLMLGQYFPKINYYLSQFDEYYVYSEYPKLFRDACIRLRIGYGVLDEDPYVFYPNYGKIGAELFNDILNEIRAMSCTLEFKKIIYNRQYNSKRNFQSGLGYIDALFVRYSRLLVLRVDFGYLKAQCATIEEAQQDIEHYLNNRRGNSLFETRVGYIIKLECTVEKGPHLHCFFFLDGSQSYQDVYLAQEYGNYWVKLTEGRGVFFNCNMKKSNYEYCGVGMIHHADAEMRENLLLPVKYITKSDQYVTVKANPKSRVFWRGEMPGERTTNSGRPRQ